VNENNLGKSNLKNLKFSNSSRDFDNKLIYKNYKMFQILKYVILSRKLIKLN